MKKFLFAAACVLALGLTSCGDTNYCYEVTAKYKVGGIPKSTTYLWWGTKNDLKTYEQTLKESLGDDTELSSKRTNKSQSDCKSLPF